MVPNESFVLLLSVVTQLFSITFVHANDNPLILENDSANKRENRTIISADEENSSNNQSDLGDVVGDVVTYGNPEYAAVGKSQNHEKEFPAENNNGKKKRKTTSGKMISVEEEEEEGDGNGESRKPAFFKWMRRLAPIYNFGVKSRGHVDRKSKSKKKYYKYDRGQGNDERFLFEPNIDGKVTEITLNPTRNVKESETREGNNGSNDYNSYGTPKTTTNPTNQNENEEKISPEGKYWEYETENSIDECVIWNGLHYKAAGGSFFSFKGNCSYKLVEDLLMEDKFEIYFSPKSCDLNECSRSLTVYDGNNHYQLFYKGEIPVLMVNSRETRIPIQEKSFIVVKKSDSVVASFENNNVEITWTKQDRLSIKMNEEIWERIGGLCRSSSTPDHLQSDFYTSHLHSFIEHWTRPSEICETAIRPTHRLLPDLPAYNCDEVFSDPRFDICQELEHFEFYKNACLWDAGECGKTCACETVNEFVKDCERLILKRGESNLTSTWRKIANCPMECPPGKIYTICGPSVEPTCESVGLSEFLECREGCFCPEGKIWKNGTCLSREICGCHWNNKLYEIGEEIRKDCNNCTCQKNGWSCTHRKCGARCSVVGGVHFLTFDGKKYDFFGQCSHYLLRNKNYNIALVRRCSANLPEDDKPLTNNSSCVSSVKISIGGDVISLGEKKRVLVNEIEVPGLPVRTKEALIREACSLSIVVTLSNGIEIWSDNTLNIYIDFPEDSSNLITEGGGLCGTFNSNQNDDFLTPEGDIEELVDAFAKKWTTDDACEETSSWNYLNSCEHNSQKKIKAENYCGRLKDEIFKDCHSFLDVEPFYKMCLRDLCSCGPDISSCLCPVLKYYGNECVKRDIFLPWRSVIPECRIHCPSDQIYQPCGNSCTRSCLDIAMANNTCQVKCAEGCNCPEGLTLNSEGKCISIQDCPCWYLNNEYKSGHELIIPSDDGPKYCMCKAAKWTCRKAMQLEIARHYEEEENQCNATLNLVYTNCEPSEPKTCKNMHEKARQTSRICFPGCTCKKGFVWDSVGKICVNATECPCHHNGKSFADGDKIQKDCNTCTCANGVWSCTRESCGSVCSTWGDTHFKTFDGKMYDFEGACDFLMAYGFKSSHESFYVNLELVPCGSSGVSCPKAVTLVVGSQGTEQEKLTLKKFQPIVSQKNLKRIFTREAGLFLFAEVFDLGITLQWDKNTRLYLHADSRWKNKVRGLCGNFNDNESDDFKTPTSGEISELSATLFADSWRVHDHCSSTNPLGNTCEINPWRRAWATRQCSVLQSHVFEKCHSYVPFESYYDRCLEDACGCDTGGDCECLCSAISAYAEECTRKGVPIKWRTQSLCPMQCDAGTKYSSCISTCPTKSCLNHHQPAFLYDTCSNENCIEGCEKPLCPPDHVFINETSYECVPVSTCPTFCLKQNGVTYLEGELMEQDNCHKCFCSFHKKICIGKPCLNEAIVLTTFKTGEQTSTPTLLITAESQKNDKTTHSGNLNATSSSSICDTGYEWDDCIVNCDHICHYPRAIMQCFDNCLSGCKPIGLKCPPEAYLRNDYTCVEKKDCLCLTSNVVAIKPGDVIQTSECEKCQCIDNKLECIFTCPEPAHEPIPLHTKFIPKSDILYVENASRAQDKTTKKSTSSPLCPPDGYESLLDDSAKFSASSYLKDANAPEHARMSDSNGGWIAEIDDSHQFLQIDLEKVVPIFGVNVAGSFESYMTRYYIKHSIDGRHFFDILDVSGEKKVFAGPPDSYHSGQQIFSAPVEARYVQFRPISWHNRIGLKVDILGCRSNAIFSTTPLSKTTPQGIAVSTPTKGQDPLIANPSEKEVLPSEEPSEDCLVCKGALVNDNECKCRGNKWWNGRECVTHSECPCFVGSLSYPVGTTYATANCEECICRLYGIPHCFQKTCAECPEGMQKILTPLCGCTCKSCEENSTFCPSSNICLENSLWCDGIEHCPDDEINCPASKIPEHSDESKSTVCQASCLSGYNVSYQINESGLSSKDQIRNRILLKNKHKAFKNKLKFKREAKLTDCLPYDCIPTEGVSATDCPQPKCPNGYDVVTHRISTTEMACLTYTCKPILRYDNCSISSGTVKTFDETEYQYKVHDHLLVRNNEQLWNITMVRNCNFTTEPFSSTVLISHGNDSIELRSPSRSVYWESFSYSEHQMSLLNSMADDFRIDVIGNSLIFTSFAHGFVAVLDDIGNVEIRVVSKMKGHLDGLCGLYNGVPEDDKTFPDGKLSKTVADFGNSWRSPGGEECEIECSLEKENTALEICSILSKKPFASCSKLADRETCIETVCECLSKNRTEDECRCSKLKEVTSKCSPNPELFGWRIEHDCPPLCPSNRVYYDCYPYACEPSCGNVDECAEPSKECFSGCFCPEGTVRKEDECIKVTDCRDCFCSALGDSSYLTFNDAITFNGNCTYVASRSKGLSDEIDFEVLISNDLCDANKITTCTKSVEIKTTEHSILFIARPEIESVKIVVDDAEKNSSNSKIITPWSKIEISSEMLSVSANLFKQHLEVHYNYKAMTFSISLPSHIYNGKLDGICGSCNAGIDLETFEGPKAWQLDPDEKCTVEPEVPCVPTPEQKKLCEEMKNFEKFGQCPEYVDPTPFIDQCLKTICFNDHPCISLAAFAQACRDVGICVNWRSEEFCPFTCPSDLEYQPCRNGCIQTCENYNDPQEHCMSSSIEGCFCPNDGILFNGTCKPEKFCEFCDEEGNRREGDTWKQDKCTNCACADGVIICNRTTCQATEIKCKEDEIVVESENDGECCPQNKCVCKPREECEDVTLLKAELPVGMEAIINESGCCPVVEIVCRKELCPVPQPCRSHYIETMINDTECCPEYSCEKPPNLCIYQLDSENLVNGKEGKEDGSEIIKEIGERWLDGPCKSCFCTERDGYAEAVCMITDCPKLEDHPDHHEYILSEVINPEKCCPEVERKGCKHNGRTYKVGDSWMPNPSAPCEMMKCKDSKEGGIHKEIRLQICNADCDKGWKYVQKNGECCGQCVPIGCVVEGKVYEEGEEWSSEDKCARNACVKDKNGQFYVSTVMESCPSIDFCPEEALYRDGCCLKCNLTPQNKGDCAAESVLPVSTIGLIKVTNANGSVCRNEHSLSLNHCIGYCRTHSEINPDTLEYENICKCCQTFEWMEVKVLLKCEDGEMLEKSLSTPKSCRCSSCGN